MGTYVLTLVKKLIVKSLGIKISLVVAANLTLLLIVSNSFFTASLTLALVSMASLASLFIDFKLHSSTFYALYLCGSRPKDMRLLMLMISLINSVFFSIPYMFSINVYGFIAFLIATITSFTFFNYIYIKTRSSSFIPHI